MFTGLIEAKGIITRSEAVGGGLRLEVYAPEFGRDMAIGDSIAVDGACLTVVKFIRGAFLTDVSQETAEGTTLGTLQQGTKVNLERALRMSDRMGGHMVSGHVDGTGSLVMRHASGNASFYQFHAPPEIMQYVIPKGSIAVDGISLTVAQVRDDGFVAAVIPHTESSTTLGEKPTGSPVNLEVDLMAKYVKRFVALYVGAEDDAPRVARRGLGDMLQEFADGR
jgi:riboflavin synthase